MVGILPKVRRSELTPGLLGMDVNEDDAERYIGIVERRVRENRTGAQWQRDFAGRHGRDINTLTSAYWEQQESGEAVADWAWPC